MPRTVPVRPGNLAAVIRHDADMRLKGIREAIRSAAKASVDLLRSVSPVDQGAYAAAWVVKERANGDLTVWNDSPYAGIIEAGARPHHVNEEGRLAIEDWCTRHGFEDPKAAAWAICAKIAREGSRAHWVVRNSLPLMVEIIAEELAKVPA